MSRLQRPFFSVFSLVLLLSTPAVASSFGDLNCDDSINVTDVQLSIIVALGMPLSEVLDADKDGTPDACPAEVSCGVGTVLEGGVCTVDQAELDIAFAEGYDSGVEAGETSGYQQGFLDGKADGLALGYADGQTDGYQQGFLDGKADGLDLGYTNGFADGVASVDITTDNQAAFDDGVASVDITTDNQQAYDEGVASVDITSNDQEVYDGAYAAGADSVDITTDNQAAFDDGVASVEPVECDLSDKDLSDCLLYTSPSPRD